MLIENGDGTYTGGALDVLLILHHVENGTYHPALFLEAPMPGPVPAPEDIKVVRVRSRFHHTTGAPTLEEAQAILDELAEKVIVPDANRWREQVFDWDGELGMTLLLPNWLTKKEAI